MTPSSFAAFDDISGGGEIRPLSITECRLERVLPEVLERRSGGAAPPNILVSPLDIGGLSVLSALSDEESFEETFSSLSGRLDLDSREGFFSSPGDDL